MKWISLFFLVSVIAVPWRGLDYGCLSAYDLGIFSQNLMGVWRGEWDPFIPLREIFASQDHWDPIVQVVAVLLWPFAGIFSAPRLLLIAEAIFVLGSAWYAWNGLRQRGFPDRSAKFGFFLVLFAPVTWAALRVPVHPTTWALLPQIGFLFWAWDGLRDEKFEWVWAVRGLFWIIFLGICGEQFALAAATGTFGLLIFTKGPRRAVGLGLLICALFSAWWAMKGRAILHDGVYNHAGRLRFSLSEIWAQYEFGRSALHRLLESALAFGPLIYWSLREFLRAPFRRGIAFICVCAALFSPLLAGRMLAASWGAQYGIVWTAFAVGILFLAPRLNISTKQFRLALALLILTSVSGWGLVFHFVQTPAPGCDATRGEVSSEEWRSRKEELADLSRDLEPESKVVANLFLIPSLLDRRPDLDLHSIGIFQMRERERRVQAVLFADGNLGNAWPLSDVQIQDIRARLESSATASKKTTISIYEGSWDPEFFDTWSAPQVLKQ